MQSYEDFAQLQNYFGKMDKVFDSNSLYFRYNCDICKK